MLILKREASSSSFEFNKENEHPAKVEDDSATSVKFARFKREVYHNVLHIIFNLYDVILETEKLSPAVTISHVFFIPEFLLPQLMEKNPYCICATRGVQALHPFPRCLMHESKLYHLALNPKLQMQETMELIYTKALHLNDHAAEALLKDNGLHLIEVCLIANIYYNSMF